MPVLKLAQGLPEPTLVPCKFTTLLLCFHKQPLPNYHDYFAFQNFSLFLCRLPCLLHCPFFLYFTLVFTHTVQPWGAGM
jgi:hypothetical protein